MTLEIVIRGSNATAYKFIDIWVSVGQIQDVQYPLGDADTSQVTELEFSSHYYGINYSGGLISVTALPPAVEPSTLFNLLDCHE